MITRINIYNLYDNGNLIFTGDKKQCAEIIGCQEKSLIHKYTHKDAKMFGRYTLKLAGTENREYGKVRKKIEKIETRKPTTLEYLIKHISRYGNTILNEDPQKYLQPLKQEGYDCTIRKVKEEGTKKYFYVIEVKDV